MVYEACESNKYSQADQNVLEELKLNILTNSHILNPCIFLAVNCTISVPILEINALVP